MSTNANATLEQGFTIIEILVAMALFSIAITVLISGLLNNTYINTSTQQKADSARIVETQLEQYRQVNDYGTLQSGTGNPNVVNTTVTSNGQDYTVVATFCPNDLASATAAAMPCSPTAVYVRLEVKNGNKSLQKVETYFTKFGKAE